MAKDRYLFVEARGWFDNDVETVDGDIVTALTDDPVSFDSIIIEAESIEDAYDVGEDALIEQQANTTDDDIKGHLTGELMNSYVVKL